MQNNHHERILFNYTRNTKISVKLKTERVATPRRAAFGALIAYAKASSPSSILVSLSERDEHERIGSGMSGLLRFICW